MHWTTYRHIPGDTPERATRPQARQANSVLDAAAPRYRISGPRATGARSQHGVAQGMRAGSTVYCPAAFDWFTARATSALVMMPWVTLTHASPACSTAG